MESFLGFFEELTTLQKLAWVIGCLSFFWILEGYYTFSKKSYKKWRHALSNAAFMGFTMLINVVFGILTVGVFVWTNQQEFGLLYLFELPVILELLIALLVLDFIAQYGVHYLLHKVPAMWRLHIIHHSDKNVDVTTGTRHHPLDFVLRETFALLAVFITGMPVAFYLFYRILSVLFTYWTHANIQLPAKLDKALSYVIVTPTLHKFHHHREMPWTDTNFGNMFSIWDRFFGTFLYDDPSKIVYGVDIADHLDDQHVGVQLGIPFNKSVRSKKASTM
ncbi:hypothetical protein GCM10009117_18720 [Gangjinia marincola]|uniref:Fatty acid hydroxylase domain-containing protein n=1 Tax=Gangjinia marincola TaxID=578463 RepID=A0ABP3XU10_9FLAO